MVIMMQVSFRQMILLSCLKKLNGERTIYSIYHLLQGKKSSQTIQDAHLFGLSRFFYLEPALTREELDIQGAALKASGFITETEEQRFILTEQGEVALEEALVHTPIPDHLNGWKYGRTGTSLWERLSLVIQVISHLQHRETKYIPVQRKPETLLWVKDFLKIHALSRHELAKKLFKELTDCLESKKTINPALFVIRLSGSGHIGLTETQAARKMNLDPVYYHYQFLNILHYLAAEMEDNIERYPILSVFLDRQAAEPLTHSTKKTYSLLQQGLSLDDIIDIRRLKQSTIEDHLVELALHLPQFAINEYVNREKQQQIKQAIILANTKQLREIRKYAPETSYFEIRLVLAKFGDDIC